MRPFKMQISRQSLQKNLLFCFSVVFSLLLGEAALQFALDSMHNKGYYFMSPHHKVVFRPNPGIMPGIFRESNFYTNSRGIRGEDFTTQDTYRFLAVGGSTTQCSYLDQPETWAHLTQEILNRKIQNQKIWVGNGGVSGTTTRHHLVALQTLPLKEMKINAVILLIGINDLSRRLSHDKDYDPDYLKKPEIEKELLYQTITGTYHLYSEDTFYKKSAIWQMLRKAKQMLSREHIEDEDGRIYITWREHRHRAAEIRNALPDLSSALEEYASNINMIINLAQEKSVRLILITQPTMWKSGLPQNLDTLLWLGGIGDFQKESGKVYYSVTALEKGMKAYNDTLLRVCRERRVECLDLASVLEKNTTVFYDDVDFNESGARNVAEVLSKYVLDRNHFLESQVAN